MYVLHKTTTMACFRVRAGQPGAAASHICRLGNYNTLTRARAHAHAHALERMRCYVAGSAPRASWVRSPLPMQCAHCQCISPTTRWRPVARERARHACARAQCGRCRTVHHHHHHPDDDDDCVMYVILLYVCRTTR